MTTRTTKSLFWAVGLTLLLGIVLVGAVTFYKANSMADYSAHAALTAEICKRLAAVGIYEVDGDVFKSCFGKSGAERPADFTSKPGDGRTLSVWKREKQAAPAPEQK